MKNNILVRIGAGFVAACGGYAAYNSTVKNLPDEGVTLNNVLHVTGSYAVGMVTTILCLTAIYEALPE